MSRIGHRLLGCLLGLVSSGCGVFFGDPIELFPEKLGIDGGIIDHVSPCVEQVQRLSGNSLTIFDVPARNVAALVEPTQTTDLIWPGTQASTQVTVAYSNVLIYAVHSRINEAYAKHQIADQCADHVRIDAQLSITTADGRLNESGIKIRFEAFNEFEAQATITLQKSALKGTYAPTSFGQACFASTTFNLLQATNGTNGAMLDQFQRSCADADAGVITTVAGGHWGDRWTH